MNERGLSALVIECFYARRGRAFITPLLLHLAFLSFLFFFQLRHSSVLLQTPQFAIRFDRLSQYSVRTVLSVVRPINFCVSRSTSQHLFDQPTTFSQLISTLQEVRLLSCLPPLTISSSISSPHILSLPCPLCGILFCLDVSFFA